MVAVRIQYNSFACGYPGLLVPFVEKYTLSLWNCLGTLTKQSTDHKYEG